MIVGGNNDYPDLETVGPNWSIFAACVARLAVAIRADSPCYSWLTSRSGSPMLNDLLDYPEKYFHVATHFLNKDGTPDPGTDATHADMPGHHVIVNMANFQRNSELYNWDTILHEMAHILDAEGFIEDDAEDDAAQAHNSNLLQQHCGKVLTYSAPALEISPPLENAS